MERETLESDTSVLELASGPTVEVELTVENYVHDGLVRRRGERITVTESEARELKRRRRVVILPLMRALVDHVMAGNRVLARGEAGFATNLHVAMERYKLGHVEILNLEELGLTRAQLPRRKGERPASAPQLVKLRANVPLHLSCHTPGYVAKGQEFEAERPRAEDIVRDGFAEPIGWTPGRRRQAILRAARDHAVIGHRICRKGELVAADDCVQARDADRLNDGWVRVRSIKPDCFIGDRTLGEGEVAEVHVSVAEDLLTEGAAVLTTDPVSAAPAPKRARGA